MVSQEVRDQLDRQDLLDLLDLKDPKALQAEPDQLALQVICGKVHFAIALPD